MTDTWRILALSEYQDWKFVSAVEHKSYPFVGLQFHPEKNAYEWNEAYHNPHSRVRDFSLYKITTVPSCCSRLFPILLRSVIKWVGTYLILGRFELSEKSFRILRRYILSMQGVWFELCMRQEQILFKLEKLLYLKQIPTL